MKALALSVVLTLCGVSQAASQSDTAAMSKTVEGFYGAYETFRPPDGIPDAKVRVRFEPYISPSLDKLLEDSEHAEDRYEKATKGQYPPLVEGDPFTPSFDGATSFSVGPCQRDARGGRCAVNLSYSGSSKPLSWTDTVELVHGDAGWRVNDISYGGNWDGGNRGTLSETLRNAIEHGNEIRE